MLCGSYKGDEKVFVTQWLHYGDGSDHIVTQVVAANTKVTKICGPSMQMR